MRILLTTDPELRVPPELYGGIERIVAFLARGLVARGHQVTLFARADSEVPCEVVGWHGVSSLSRMDTLRNLAQFTRYALGVREPHVIHSFARLAYLSPLLANRTPKIQSYQRYVTPRSVRGGHVLSRGSLTFTACSANCAQPVSNIGGWRIVHNGVDLDLFDYQPTVAPDAPLVFLGRIEPVKGTHHAIAIARRSGRKLIIAGNVPARGPEAEYARAVLAQCDDERIRYVGPVNDAQKNEWLGTAAALVFPIEWEEPFGIVMAEALACGTPVLALARGSVPEVVRDGQTGFSRTTVDELVTCVGMLDSISRAACRRDAEERFSSDVIVDQYESLYRQRLANC